MCAENNGRREKMATWMVHLRVADSMMDELPNLDKTAFVVGNIAPDSGVPNEDWSRFTPNTMTSHFKKNEEGKEIDIERFKAEYLSAELIQVYNERQYSFFLGYWTHLFTDIMWAKKIWIPCKEKYRRIKNLTESLTYEEKQDMIWAIKADWYDLDFLYLQQHPDFRAFQIYRSAIGFKNEYMTFFAEDAFENRREYITDFYLEGRENLDREYMYLTEKNSEEFVKCVVGKVINMLDIFWVK